MNTISSHDAFFQKFIDIIPKEIYENDDTIEINTKYYKHRKVPLTADEKKVLSKKRLKEKYRNSMEEEDEREEMVDDEIKTSHGVIPSNLSSLSLSVNKKKKSSHTEIPKNLQNSEPMVKNKGISSTNTSKCFNPDLHQSLLIESSNLDRTEYNEVNIRTPLSEAGKPGSKIKRLKRMLNEAENKRKRLEEFKKLGGESALQAVQEIWSDTLLDASGSKSVGDTTKLRKALKRVEKYKQKSSNEWQARIEALDEAKTLKQERRTQNIKNRKLGGMGNINNEKDLNSNSNQNFNATHLLHYNSNSNSNKRNDNTTSSRGGSQTFNKSYDAFKKPFTKSPNNQSIKSKYSNTNMNTNVHKGNINKSVNRPGFEGKKKANSDFLNQKN